MNCNRCNDMLIDAKEAEAGICFACHVDQLETKKENTTNDKAIKNIDNKIDVIYETLGWF